MDDDDDDDAYVTHALQALHALNDQRTRATDDRKENEQCTSDDGKRAEHSQHADWRDQHKRPHAQRHAPNRRHSSEKTSRSSRQRAFPFTDSSSSLSALLTASTSSSSSSSGSAHSPRSSSAAFASPLDRAYTARFRHLSSSLLSLLSSLPSDPSLPVLLRSPLTASYLSERLRELLVNALEEEREMAVKAAWEAAAAEEDRRRQAQQENDRLVKERAADKAQWEEERATLHRQLQQCEQALRAERHSNEQWEAARQLLEQRAKDEEQQREAAEADCQRLEDAVGQLQQKYKAQQQSYAALQQHSQQVDAQLEQLQLAHTGITLNNTQLNAQLATQQAQQQAEVKELTSELNQRRLALLHKENEWRVREEQLTAERRGEAERLGKAVKEWKRRYSDVALRVKALSDEKDEQQQRNEREADARVKEKAAREAEVERLTAALREQRERMDERVARMKELTVREWKEREAELLSAVAEERGRAEELLGWVDHSSEQMAAMKQRLLGERDEKHRADAEWQAERQRWEQSTAQREERLKAAEQSIAAQQQQLASQSQQLASDIAQHAAQLSEANERAGRVQQQLADVQAQLRRAEAEVAAQREQGKEMLAHARVELERRQKDSERVEARMRQLQPQLLHNARRLSQLSAMLPPLLATVRQLKQSHMQLSVVWRLECQSMGVGWDGLRAVVGRWEERRRLEGGERLRAAEEAVLCRRNFALLLNALSSLFAVPLPLQHQLLSSVASTAFFTNLQSLHAHLSAATSALRDEREALQREAKAREEAERRGEQQREAWWQQRQQQLQDKLGHEANERVQRKLADVARRSAEVERVCSAWLQAADDGSSRQLWTERLSVLLTMLRAGLSGRVAAPDIVEVSSDGYGALDAVDMGAVLDEMRRAWEVRVQQMQAGVL